MKELFCFYRVFDALLPKAFYFYTMCNYQLSVSYSNPLSQLIDVQLLISGAGDTFQLQIPAWRPGRYELQNYARYVYPLTISKGEGTIKKLTKDKWEVKATGEVEISFQFYAARMDAGSSWVDEEQLYLNFSNFAPSIVGKEDQPIDVVVTVPETYQFACALKEIGGKFRASCYYELIDSPLIASATLKHFKYEVMGTCFHIWIQGLWQPNEEQLLHDFAAFTQVQLELFGGFPNPDFHFLIQALPYRFYHGVEHQNSTVVALGPHEELSDWKWYKELLGVSSHELFHCWNVTRIRPEEMVPYDFSKEAYHTTGYVTEGLTTYYGDLMLRKCGVFKDEHYLEEVNSLLKRYYQNEGRTKASLTDSSFDLWLDGYNLGAPNRKVSIYNEGALYALLLDLKIITTSNGLESLTSVMLDLWHEHGAIGKGYSAAHYKDIVSRYITQSGDYFKKYIEGTKDVREELTEVLAAIGCDLKEKQSEDELEQLGLRTLPKGEQKEIIRIAENSVAAQKLMIGEVILSHEKEEGKHKLTVARKGIQREVVLDDSGVYFSYYEVKMNAEATEEQLRLRGKWLGE